MGIMMTELTNAEIIAMIDEDLKICESFAVTQEQIDQCNPGKKINQEMVAGAVEMFQALWIKYLFELKQKILAGKQGIA